MKITTSGAIETISGKHGNFIYLTRKSGEVFAMNNNKRREQKPNEFQQLVKNFAAFSTQNWDMLTDAQRVAWLEYAKAHFSKDDTGRKVTPSGIATYVRANFYRQMLGLSLTQDAPTLSPPVGLNSIEQLGAQNPDTVGITVFHGHTVLTNLMVVLSVTAQGKTQGDAPGDGAFRLVCGAKPGSALALPATGSDLVFTGARFEVQDGMRYGVRARVLRTTDGMVSRPVQGDFRKLV